MTGVQTCALPISRNRLKDINLITNPFEGTVKRLPLKLKDKDHYILVMDSMYPKFYQAGYYFLVMMFFIIGFRWSKWYLPGLILISLGLFWSRFFMYLGLFFGLKKAGYKGKVKLLRDSTSLRDMLNEVL